MEIDKIKRVALGQASKREREEVNVWAEGAEERKRLLADAKLFYGREMPGEDEISDRVERMWKRRRVPVGKLSVYDVVASGGSGRMRDRGCCIALWFAGGSGNEKKNFVVADNKEVRLILPDGSAHGLSTSGEKTVNIPGFRVNREGTVQENGTECRNADITNLKYNEIVVPRGGEYSLTLADGTVMRLNSDTRVRFPNTFTGEERRVFLAGEAYFEVARDTSRPFLVEFSEGVVQVLGTHFNVKVRRGQSAFATLVSGKVKVSSGRDSVVLKPGEYCEIKTGNHQLSVHEADMMSVLAWKNGEFVFKDASLEHVMNELACWYDMDVVYASDDLKGIKLHIYMNRTQTLEEALEIMSKMGNVIYQVQGRKIIVKKQ
ncbi:MAG: FecR family protein [Butyricimonas virosa]